MNERLLDEHAYVFNNYPFTRRRFAAAGLVEQGGGEAWQASFRGSLQDVLGLTRIRQSTHDLELDPRKISSCDCGTHVREKWVITSEPGLAIAFYFLIPKQPYRLSHHLGQEPERIPMCEPEPHSDFDPEPDANIQANAHPETKKLPLMIVLHGHDQRGKESLFAQDMDIALQAVGRGYAVMVPDVRGFGELARSSDLDVGRHNSCAPLQTRALMLGRTLIGERVHDISRLIDYARTRPELDSQIVVTGYSGGAAVALFAAACDVRISVAVPVSYFCTFKDSILSIDHCICNVIPGVLELGEMHDIAGLIAPRPVLIVHGVLDKIFPVAATKTAFSQLQAIYESMGVSHLCELALEAQGHQFYQDPIWPFLLKHVKLA